MGGILSAVSAFFRGKTGLALGAALAAILLAGGGFWAGRATAPVATRSPPATVADANDDDSYSDDASPAATPAPSSETPAAVKHRGHRAEAGASVIAAATKASGTKYVHRNNSDLRKAPSYASETIKKEPKGAALQMIAVSDKWAEVQDGSVKGWMRASVLKDDPPGDTKSSRKKKPGDSDDGGDSGD
ncbi:MAG TPA: hypothetical protein VGF56_12175 [Rhizomicrobium sp.]|jgi:hypothetical protein